uniref:HTH CENPB-type domain-containing protein n=1 Tax=Peronospora matthiolae TaxID=2874970 RepID=A0AAV1VPL5_9STRA
MTGSSSSSSSSKGVVKRKRVVLSIHDKQQVLQRLDNGAQPLALAQDFGISRQQVSDIKKNRARILSFCGQVKCLSKLKRKTLTASPVPYPGVEQELYRWLVRQRTLARHVSRDALKAKTTNLFRQYAADTTRPSISTMTSWLGRFRKAYGLQLLSDRELQQLPEQFTSVMGTTEGTGGDGEAAGRLDAVSVQVDGQGLLSRWHKVEKEGDENGRDWMRPSSVVSLQTTVDTLQQLNRQLTRFEREMAVKLDYLDERVVKLCYFVLPSPQWNYR